MATNYPGSLDTFDTIGASDEMNDEVGTRTHREMHNDANDAIEAIEAELGTSPSGSYDTVAARLAASDPSALLVKANNLSDLTSASAARTALGLGTMATATATDYLTKAGNLAGLADLPTARQNLGLGTMATATASDYLSKAGNLGGIADPAVARTNLGLGTMATQASSAYAALAGATFTGDLTVGSGGAGASQLREVKINGASGSGSGGYFSVYSNGSLLGALGRAGAINGGASNILALYAATNFQIQMFSTPTAIFSPSSTLLSAYNASAVPVIARGAPAHATNLQNWSNSSDTVLASISAAGLGTFAGVTSTENVAVTKSQSATTRIGVTNGSTNANALAEIRATTDAGYTGLFKHPAAYGGYKILGASDAAIYNSTAGHISILNDVASGVIRFAAGGASSAQVQIETTGKLTTFTPTTAAASVRLPHGTAPTTPADGDMWTTAAGLYVHINGSTVGPLS